MNIEELGASDPGGLASSIIDGRWLTGMLAVAYLFGKPAIYNLFGWGLPPGSDDDDMDDLPHHW